MQSKKLLLVFLSLCFCYGAFTQNLQQEQREMRRKNNNPYEPGVERTRVKQVFKLKGYTDSTQIIFSTMATCKMACLSLEEKDVRKVLKEGLVNINLSDVASAEKIFSVEYDPGKRLRVVVTPKGYFLLVITVSTIDKKTECDCKQ